MKQAPKGGKRKNTDSADASQCAFSASDLAFRRAVLDGAVVNLVLGFAVSAMFWTDGLRADGMPLPIPASC